MTLEQIFSDGAWDGSGKNYVIRCPVCGDSTTHNHCYINPDDGVVYCFHCGYKARLNYFLKMYGGGATLSGRPSGTREKKRRPPVDISDLPRVTGALGTLDRLALDYLHKRGLDDKAISRYDIRFGQNKGRLYGRVIFPIVEAGQIVCFVARSFLEFVEPRYLFPHHGETLLTTAEALFGYPGIGGFAEKDVVITEGVFDAIAVERQSAFSAVALCSKFLHHGQKWKLEKTGAKAFYVMLDADAIEDGRRVAFALKQIYGSVYFCRLSQGDPASITHLELNKALSRAIPITYEETLVPDKVDKDM